MKFNFNRNLYSYFLFSIVFLIGFNIFKDFSVYGDEPIHRWIGSIYYAHYKEIILNFNFQNEHLNQIISLSNDDHFRIWVAYPIFFDLFTEFLVDILNLKDEKNIFELRHFINFFIFFLSLIFFYKIIIDRFKNYYLSILSVLFIFLSPRIFADSFYNSKDILFLSFSIINIYFSIKLINCFNTKNLFIYSISTGLLIQSRLMGLLFLVITFFIIIFPILDDIKNLKTKIKKFFLFLFFIFFIIFIFWPFLWSDPVKNFIYYFNFTKTLDTFSNLYFGETILSTKTPLTFKYVWMSMTIPLSVLFLSIIGLIINFIKFFNRTLLLDKNSQIWFNKEEVVDFFILLLLICPLIAILQFRNNFDGWRHLYYLFPFMVYHSVLLIDKIINTNKKLFSILNFLVLINLFFTSHWMIKFHPFQYTYFNFVHKLYNKDFNIDYTGSSITHSLKYILKKDKRIEIKVAGIGETYVEGSIWMIEKENRKRLKVVNLSESDYIIDTLRPKVGKAVIIDKKKYFKFFELTVDGNVVNQVFKKNNI